jgi:hypothetical protein
MSDNSYGREPQGCRIPSPMPLPDDICMAVGCEEKAADSTLMGLRFCPEHISAWYSSDTPRVKREAWGE